MNLVLGYLVSQLLHSRLLTSGWLLIYLDKNLVNISVEKRVLS